jgi:hypothetical protein
MTEKRNTADRDLAACRRAHAEMLAEAARCTYCQRVKRGWRRLDDRTLCSDCERKVRQ